MNILDVLASGSTAYRGKGVNHEGEAFIGELRVRALQSGRAVLLSYSATLETGIVVHSESTLLGTGPDGTLCLWPLMAELPVVLPHTEVMSESESGKYMMAVFGSGQRDDSAHFREEISIQVNADGGLVYAHAWGLPYGNFEDRSSCSMVPSGAEHLAQAVVR